MVNGLGVTCVSYIRIIMWKDSTDSTGSGLTSKNNITYNNAYFKRYIEL